MVFAATLEIFPVVTAVIAMDAVPSSSMIEFLSVENSNAGVESVAGVQNIVPAGIIVPRFPITRTFPDAASGSCRFT